VSTVEQSRPGPAATASRAPAGLLVVGLGSAGRRHLRSLMALETLRPLRVLRSGHGAASDADWRHLPEHRDLEAALAERPAAVVVANPTALHVPVALAAARAGDFRIRTTSSFPSSSRTQTCTASSREVASERPT
jgi:hypothetical protein